MTPLAPGVPRELWSVSSVVVVVVVVVVVLVKLYIIGWQALGVWLLVCIGLHCLVLECVGSGLHGVEVRLTRVLASTLIYREQGL